MESNQVPEIVMYEQIANLGTIDPQAQIFDEVNCCGTDDAKAKYFHTHRRQGWLPKQAERVGVRAARRQRRDVVKTLVPKAMTVMGWFASGGVFSGGQLDRARLAQCHRGSAVDRGEQALHVIERLRGRTTSDTSGRGFSHNSPTNGQQTFKCREATKDRNTKAATATTTMVS